MPSLVLVQHSPRLDQVDIGSYWALRRTITIVVVHFKVDKRFPVAAFASELRELGYPSAFRALFEVNLCVLVAALRIIPVFRWIEILDFLAGLTDLILAFGIVRVTLDAERLHIGLAPAAAVIGNDEVNARIGHGRSNRCIVLANQNRAHVLRIHFANAEGFLVGHALHVVEDQLSVRVQPLDHKTLIDLYPGLAEDARKRRHLGICLARKPHTTHIVNHLHHVEHVNHFEIAEALQAQTAALDHRVHRVFVAEQA